MELTPAKFLALFLLISGTGWLLFNFTARLLAWILSRMIKAHVRFRFGGLNCIKDVYLQFKKGPLESLVIGEVRVRTCRPSLDAIESPRSFVLQVSLYDAEVLLRKKSNHAIKKESRPKQHASGRGKWVVFANIAQYLTVSVVELVVQVPDWMVEVRELDLVLDSKESGSFLGVKLAISACNIYQKEQLILSENSLPLGLPEKLLLVGGSEGNGVGTPGLLSLDHFSVNSSFGHEREQGVIIRQLDVVCGEVLLDVNEGIFGKKLEFTENDESAEGSEANLHTEEPNQVINSKNDGQKAQGFPIKNVPEKASFNLPRLLFKCSHKEKEIVLENEVTGIQFCCNKIQDVEESGTSLTRLDIHMESGEIQLMREADKSLVEVMKLDISASLDAYKRPHQPLQAEFDLKLGGAQCNLLTYKFEKWVDLVQSLKPRKDPAHGIKKKSAKSKVEISWRCTFSAPDVVASVYGLDGIVLYHVCLQSSHLFVSSMFKQEIEMHMELGELHVYLVEEENMCYKGLFGMDTNPGCLLQMSRVTVDWNLIEPQTANGSDQRNVTMEITGTAMHLTLHRLQSLFSSSILFASHFKNLIAVGARVKKGKEGTGKRAKGGKKIKKVNLNLEGLSIQFCEKLHLLDMKVPDPKKVNFGTQGGLVQVEKNEDGKPRLATVKAAMFSGIKGSELVGKSTLDVAHVQLHFDHDKGDTQMDLQRVTIAYQELGTEMKPVTNFTIAALQNGKIVYRTAVFSNGVPRCLICAGNLKGRWEPDAQLFFHDAFLQLKTFIQLQRQSVQSNSSASKKEKTEHAASVSEVPEKGAKSQSLDVAVDIEHVEVSAALADGVEGSLSIVSVFSEDFKVGILLEDVKVALNGADIIRSKRLQAARLPACIKTTYGERPTVESSKCRSCWDYIIQGSGVHIILPHRLECRALDDAIEDTWRSLKLAMTAQKISICDIKGIANHKPKRKSASSSSLGAVRFVFECITAEIEEEPLQGWLDEHYRLLSKHKLELEVRERMLDELISDGGRVRASELGIFDTELLKSCNLDSMLKAKELDLSDPFLCNGLKELLQRQTFQAYYRACRKLRPYEDSGSPRSAFQSGFRPSVNRGSLVSVKATNLEVVLLDIDGGIPGMIKQIRKLDCIPSEVEIPFSRILGKRVRIATSSLVLQLRDYTFPMLAATSGRCEGQMIFARQATCFPRQVPQDIYVGRWRKVTMLRSESGTTPPFKMYSELPLVFDKVEVAYGVGFEPAFTDLSYAFTVALRRADLSVHDLVENTQPLSGADLFHIRTSLKTLKMFPQPVKKERSLPWWDDMRYYIHGRNSIVSTNFKWVFLATTDPYEKRDMMTIEAGSMDIQQQEGHLSFLAKEFNLSITSSESLPHRDASQFPLRLVQSGIQSPSFQLDIRMDWDCETSKPLFHYLHALPIEHVTREKLYDPFRSTSLILRWNFQLGDSLSTEQSSGTVNEVEKHHFHRSPVLGVTNDTTSSSSHAKTTKISETPTMNLGGQDLIWIFKWWGTYYSPPHKLRTFSKWPRFGVARVPRSGNLSLDKVLTDFMLRVDATPAQIKHGSVGRDDPAEGLTFNMKRLRYELCYSRGRLQYTFDSKRDILELVYQGLDLHMLKANLKRDELLGTSDKGKVSECVRHDIEHPETGDDPSRLLSKSIESGFFFTTDYFSLRKQAPKAELSRLSAWQQEGRAKSSNEAREFAPDSGSDPTRSDPSDDDGFNTVLPDNCLRVSLYGLKLLWTIPNRDAVWAWVEDIYRAFESPKPSPSRQYAQRKAIEEQNKTPELDLGLPVSLPSAQNNKGSSASPSPSRQEKPLCYASPNRKGSDSISVSRASSQMDDLDEFKEEGTMHFMVNVVQPQFNLHSEDARGRFLLAAASGRVLARSFHSVINVRPEMIAQELKPGGDHLSGNMPELTWNRRELSVILEQVQAHVAPTDVDPGAGLQWLPKIPRGSPKVKRTGALLERVFMPCAMYFQYTRCKGETADLKVKPLKELSFNSSNIIASMTSRQFQVMVDIISNLLLARLPKPRRNTPSYGGEEEDMMEEETDEVVPDGLPEIELARIALEESERELRLLSNDMLRIGQGSLAIETHEEDCIGDNEDSKLWMMSCGKPTLELKLKDTLRGQWKARRLAALSLRRALQRAVQQRLKEKEKNKSSPSAFRISWAIDKIVWSMVSDGEAFAEAEISNMNLNVDRDFHEVGFAQFTVKHFVVKNCLPNAKSSTVLSAWNPPSEWGRNVMLRVDAKQGAPKEGHSPLEHFQVEIYPLKIYLTETMYRMMWDYFFPEERQDNQRRQVWQASTTAVVKRRKKVTSATNELSLSSASRRERSNKTSTSTLPFLPAGVQPQLNNGEWQGVDFRLAAEILEKDMKSTSSRAVNHRRTSSFDRTWEDNLAEAMAMDIVPKLEPNLSVSSSKSTPYIQPDEGDIIQHTGTGIVNSVEGNAVKLRDSNRGTKSNKQSISEDKKLNKAIAQEEKKSSRLQHTNLEFYNIKISQVELLVTYEGSRLSITELRLLMDTFTRVEFTGTWRQFFSRVKKHIIWGVLKSVAGMQGKKFKDKLPKGQGEAGGYPGDDSDSSDSEGSNTGIYEHLYASKFRRRADRAGEGFVSSIRGLFNSQRKKAKAVVVGKNMPADDAEELRGGWTESEADSAPFARQLSISKAKRLIRRHTKKFLSSTRHRGAILFKDQTQGSPSYESELSSEASSQYEDVND